MVLEAAPVISSVGLKLLMAKDYICSWPRTGRTVIFDQADTS